MDRLLWVRSPAAAHLIVFRWGSVTATRWTHDPELLVRIQPPPVTVLYLRLFYNISGRVVERSMTVLCKSMAKAPLVRIQPLLRVDRKFLVRKHHCLQALFIWGFKHNHTLFHFQLIFCQKIWLKLLTLLMNTAAYTYGLFDDLQVHNIRILEHYTSFLELFQVFWVRH